MLQKKSGSRVRKVDIFQIELREDGVLRLYAEADEVVDMNRYRIMIKTIGEMTEGKKVPILSTAGELTIPNEEVRKYIENPEANPFCKALAIVAPSLSQKILANIYTHTVAHKRPTRTFRGEDEAIEWLRSFL